MIPCPACSQPAPEGSRFCPSCATPLDDADSSPTQTSVPSGVAPPSTPYASQPSAEQARFLPGAMLAGRYRIVGLLGRGGMGEVYRADDLKLGQPVALKFLPRELEKDPSRLGRFLNEVRLARQVSHPNVCRVYDVDEFNGQHYLSMEYVDGEDLASLLRRIGRLPKDKAIQMARQLCAGLAAAHEQGILHRDLKPGNVLIDGRGRTKITDFGLAGVAESIQGAEVRVGTPAYMAPEQISGSGVSVRSDVYSLGLVLYELYTGKRVFEAKNNAELARLQQESAPTSPSTLVEGFDPAVEHVLLRCLDKEPANRPASALAVAAALPGGDPLAAALAAGETPSPELVAAAGESIEVKRWLPWSCLAAVAIGLPLVVSLLGRVMLPEQVPLEQPPEVLQAKAQEIARDLGFDEAPTHTSQGFVYDRDYWGYLTQEAAVEDWAGTLAGSPAVVRYWYRQGPRSLAGRNLITFRPSFSDPPMNLAGMIGVMLDTRGNLIRFSRVPADEDAVAEEGRTTDWGHLFELAGLEVDAFTEVEPETVPPFFADERRSWEGSYAAHPDLPLRIEAAALRGKPVFFSIRGSWAGSAPAPAGVLLAAATVGWVLILILLLAAGWMARWNLRHGRGDRKGATRLAVFVFVWFLALWVLGADPMGGSTLFFKILVRIGLGLFMAGLTWIIYLALEPFVRRRWPRLLVSWTRLLDGRWRDPLVGRDLVIGAAFACGLTLVEEVTKLAPGWAGLPVQYELPPLEPLLGGRLGAGLLAQFLGTIFVVMLAMLIVVFARVLLRRTWAAFIVGVIFAGLFFLTEATATVQIGLTAVFALALVALLMRFGLLAATVAIYLHAPLIHGPATSSLGSWHGGFTIASIIVVVAVALYGFVTSFGGRSLIGEHAFDDA